ncbi:MAG: flagellar motor protein MotB [Candidatus Delongbacteria bacterium]
MARKVSKPPESPAAPGWTTTYGDLMSLLLVFFILLVSFSTLEMSQFHKAVGSLKGGEGIFKPGTGENAVEVPEALRATDFDRAVAELGDELAKEKLQEQVRVFWDSQGVRFILQDEVLFPPGDAALNPRYLGVLDAIAGVIRTIQVAELQVEGHTDVTPIRTARFPSNWELSTARSVAVLHYLERLNLVPARKLVAKGFAEFRPMVPNDSPQNMARNRRVEIYLLRQK